jgi:hypothetical protein
MAAKLFLHAEDRILGRLGDAEFHDLLRLDLDRFTSNRTIWASWGTRA